MSKKEKTLNPTSAKVLELLKSEKRPMAYAEIKVYITGLNSTHLVILEKAKLVESIPTELKQKKKVTSKVNLWKVVEDMDYTKEEKTNEKSLQAYEILKENPNGMIYADIKELIPSLATSHLNSLSKNGFITGEIVAITREKEVTSEVVLWKAIVEEEVEEKEEE